MARIRYTGPVDPMRVPGVGPVGKDWTACPEDIAAQFEREPGFEVERDPVGAGLKPARTEKKRSGGDA